MKTKVEAGSRSEVGWGKVLSLDDRRVLFVFQLARANDFLIFGLHSIFINLIFDISHLRKMQGGEKLCLKKPKSGMKKKTLMKKIGKRKQKKNRTVFFCASNTFSIRKFLAGPSARLE